MLTYRSQIINTGIEYDPSTRLNAVIINRSIHVMIEELQIQDLLPLVQCSQLIKDRHEYIVVVSDEWMRVFCEVLTQLGKYKYEFLPENSCVFITTDHNDSFTVSISEALNGHFPAVVAKSRCANSKP